MTMNRDHSTNIAQGLSDFLLLNVHSLPQSGLARGKAGVGLTLGLLGKYCDNEYLQDRSRDVLEEALLYKGNDLTFEDGWAGICWVLLILLKEEVLEADYMELVGEHHLAVVQNLQELTAEAHFAPSLVLGLISLISEYQNVFPSSNSSAILKTSIELLETRMLSILGDWLSSPATKRVEVARASNIVEMITQYLQYCNFSGHNPNHRIGSLFVDCYKTGQIPSNFRLGLFLEKQNLGSEVIEQNLSFGLLQLQQPIHLRNILDVLCAVRYSRPSDERQTLILSFEERIGVSLEFDEDFLIKHLPIGANRVGYAYGVSRLVLYLISKGAFHIFSYLL